MNWSSYLIQSNLYLVLFYTFYWLILRKETFFNLNRYYLLFSSLAAGLIPLIKTDWFAETAQPVQQSFVSATAVVMDGYASPIKADWTLGDILTLIYFSVILILICRLIYQLLNLNQILKDKDQPEAFSFFHKIRINRDLPAQPTIEKHELIHSTQLHSADVMLFELFAIMNWFNPIVYCYKNSIKHIHEFIADEAVLKTEIDKRPYALLLLSKSFGVNPHTLTNSFFNQSLLKKRIQMMNKPKSQKTAILKYGLSAPLFLLALVLSSAKISESKTINKFSEKIKSEKRLSEILTPQLVSDFIAPEIVDASDKGASKSNKKLNENLGLVTNVRSEINLIKSDSIIKSKSDKTANYMLNEVTVVAYLPADTTKVLTTVEVFPSFPGGMKEFGKFLMQNLRYPPAAKKEKVEGRVFCTFVVEKDGTLTDLKVVRGIGFGCDEETIRVLSRSPRWLPGIQDGRKVRVSYTIPIFFALK